jgi:hypothetical protein
MLLRNCKSLLVLVFISHDPLFTGALEEDEGIKDRRFVLIPYFHHPKDLATYWDEVKRGESDFWALSGK